MAYVLGIDTSNYTTSIALYDTQSHKVEHVKKLLPVKLGDCGIRQSDAVFHHTKQLPELLESVDFSGKKLSAVCVSSSPRETEGSYMPCFLTGVSVAKSIASVNSIPCYTVSHQQGHIAAAAYGSNHIELLKSPFISFHVSGGTTEVLLVAPHDEKIITARQIAATLDLNAGQLIDRVGVMLGLGFPCGAELEGIAAGFNGNIKIKPSLKGADCCLSGFENKISKIYKDTEDKAYVAAYTLKAVSSTLISMTERVIEAYGDLPLLYAGGVMSDEIIKNDILTHFNNAYFAPPAFSADNAVGVSVLGAKIFQCES